MLLVWVLLVLIVEVSAAGSLPTRPNIVMILADDLGYQDVGFRGSNILTPNIDKLAEDGVVLENHYVLSICAPTRASLMSGRHPIRTGFWKGNIKPREEFGLGLNETTLPEMLKRNGYSTHGVGKWHCGMYTWDHTPGKRGFDTFFGLFMGEQDYYTHKKRGHVDLRQDFHDADGNLVDIIRRDLAGQYNTYIFTEKAVESVLQHDKTSPFFLYLAYTAPHIPTTAPVAAIEKFAAHIHDSKGRRTYAAMVSILDDGVGKLVEALKAQSMLDNTILVFTSDNGAYYKAHGSNYPLRGGKSSMLEGGVRAVSFVNSPLLEKRGYRNTNLHHVTDWYPTFQKLAGDQPENHSKPQLPLDGVDIWRSISKNEPCREEVLINYRDPSMVRDVAGQLQSCCHGNLQSCCHGNLQSFVRRSAERNISCCHGNLGNITLKHGDSVNARNFFVLRWRNWKLLTGKSVELQGWSTENRLGGYEEFTDSEGKLHTRSLGAGTLLFDLSSDPRERNNVAEKHPDVVSALLDKIPGYRKNMVEIHGRKMSRAGMVNGEWQPWVTDSNRNSKL